MAHARRGFSTSGGAVRPFRRVGLPVQIDAMSESIDNLGIPPLAGICSYEQAAQPGYSVTETVELLKRYNQVASALVDITAAHLARTPEWEVKCALSLHMWLAAEHAAAIR